MIHCCEKKIWVVKLGGSLANSSHLWQWCRLLPHLPVVVVPGGGARAKRVKQAQIDHHWSDDLAHRLAIASMDRFAWELYAKMGGHKTHGIKLAQNHRELMEAGRRHHGTIWLPGKMMAKSRKVPRNWSVSSDSLAAHLAANLGAPLALIKRCESQINNSLEDWAKQSVVDEFFPISAKKLEVRLFNESQWADFRQCVLENEAAPQLR